MIVDISKQIIDRVEDIKRTNKINNPKSQKPKCPICNDVKEIIEKVNGVSRSRPCECTVKGRAISHLRFSGLSEDNLKLGWINFKCENKEQEMFLATAKMYVKNFNGIKKNRSNGMLLTGKSGRGKTLLSLITMNYLLADRVDIYYMSYRSTISQMKRDMIDNKVEYEYRLNMLKDCEVLIIDDLFKGKVTEADFNLIFEIIDYRLSIGKPAIISTECSMDELVRIDEALAGRINTMCKDYTAIFTDKIKNYRLN